MKSYIRRSINAVWPKTRPVTPSLALSRRKFLIGTSAMAAFAAMGPVEAEAWIRGLALPPYYGNPNITVTSIDTSGGIAFSRKPDGVTVIGYTPCFIHVSASNITCTGTTPNGQPVVPYEDLSYSWRSSDTSAELIANPGVRGGTVNAHTDQLGPEAVFPFRTAGTYTITLTIRARSTGGSIITATRTETVVISDFRLSPGYTAIYVDSNAAGGGDGTISAPYNDLVQAQVYARNGTNKEIFIKYGSVFSAAADATTPIFYVGGHDFAGALSGFRMTPYPIGGTGAAPIFNVSSGIGAPIQMRNGGASSTAARRDIVISGMRFTADSFGVGHLTLINCQYTSSDDRADCVNIYWDNCSTSGDRSTFIMQGSSSTSDPADLYDLLNNFGIWNCNFVSPVSTTRPNQGVTTDGKTWSFWVGGSIVGGVNAASALLTHHVYASIRQHSYYAWIDFGLGENRNMALNLNWNTVPADGGPLQYAEFVSVSECGVGGPSRFLDLSNGPSNSGSPAEVLFRNVVCQMNRVHDLPLGTTVSGFCIESFTHRYNEIWECANTQGYAPYFASSWNFNYLDGIMVTRFYGDKIYQSGLTTAAIISMPGCTLPQTITDMRMVCGQPTARHIAIGFAAQAGSVINRNQFAATPTGDGSTLLFMDGPTTRRSFSGANSWQNAGFDAQGSVVAQSWPDPANGGFGPWTPPS